MNDRKRTLEGDTSSSEDGNVMYTRKICRQADDTQPAKIVGAEDNTTPAPYASFSDLLANAAHVEFLPKNIKQHLYIHSNFRLQQAKREGIHLEDISIGSECLPTWPGLAWDETLESLHDFIQQSLVNLRASVDMGSLVHDEILQAGNRKLNEARELGIPLERIYISQRLMLAWDGEQEEAYDDLEHDLDEEDDLSIQDDQYDSVLVVSPEETLARQYNGDHGDAMFSDPPELVMYNSDSGISDMELDDSDYESDDDDGVRGVIALNNFVDSTPHYCDEGIGNVVYDVEVANAPPGFSEVDLEVFVATDDDDEVYDLPLLQMSVDKASYEFWCIEDNEAVDVEMPGLHVDSNGEVAVDEKYADDVEDLCSVEIDEANQNLVERLGSVLADSPPSDGKQTTGATRDDHTTIHPASAQSEEQEGQVTIEETEDGFRW